MSVSHVINCFYLSCTCTCTIQFYAIGNAKIIIIMSNQEYRI